MFFFFFHLLFPPSNSLYNIYSPLTIHTQFIIQLGPDVAPEITVQSVPTLSELEREVKFDVLSGASQFDGYIITPLWIGELANGLFETQNFMKEYSATEEGYSYWTDILLFYREVSFESNLI